MKSIFVLLLLSTGVQQPTTEPSGTASAESFDAFIELFHAALATGDPDIYAGFFADSVSIVVSESQRLLLTPEACITELSEFGRPDELLAEVARGFVGLEHSHGKGYRSVHNRPPKHQFVRVTATSLRFRALPSSHANVVAMLQKGLYSGQTDTNAPLLCERSTGIEWIQLELLLPTLGTVKGYVAAEYVELIPRKAPKAMKVEHVHGAWMITELSAL